MIFQRLNTWSLADLFFFKYLFQSTRILELSTEKISRRFWVFFNTGNTMYSPLPWSWKWLNNFGWNLPNKYSLRQTAKVGNVSLVKFQGIENSTTNLKFWVTLEIGSATSLSVCITIIITEFVTYFMCTLFLILPELFMEVFHLSFSPSNFAW